ncbi:MAG: SPFH domain-containing protein [Bdellovibrio sp.]|jgi:regulator of protease activity HflC (stomatin/prohibitin superfamily)
MDFSLILIGLIGFLVVGSIVTIPQGYIGVVTLFGKYRRIMMPGFNFRIPYIEMIFRRVSIQNQSIEMQFQAITTDQANVNFTAMLLFAVLDQREETIKNVAFKFINASSLMQTLTRTVEGNVRSFVATKRQNEILMLRREIVLTVKDQVDELLESWGYHLIDLQMNDINFDEEIMRSMAQIVASQNLRAAAENEGQALLIRKTKEAEAEGAAIRIAALADKEASQLRGQGVALFREEVALGMSKAAESAREAGLDAGVILFSMWTDSIKHFAEHGKGNLIMLDGSTDGMNRSLNQMMAMGQLGPGAASEKLKS